MCSQDQVKAKLAQNSQILCGTWSHVEEVLICDPPYATPEKIQPDRLKKKKNYCSYF